MTETERYTGVTLFSYISKRFFTIVTDAMYLSWSKEETEKDFEEILIAAISKFRFPRFKLYDYTPTVFDEITGDVITEGQFNFLLTEEEVDIFALLAKKNWLERQLFDTKVTQQMYGTKDFSFTSQANHINQLNDLLKSVKEEDRISQQLYKRRKMTDGYYKSNFYGLGGKNG